MKEQVLKELAKKVDKETEIVTGASICGLSIPERNRLNKQFESCDTEEHH